MRNTYIITQHPVPLASLLSFIPFDSFLSSDLGNNNNNNLFYKALLKAPEVALQSPEVIHTHSHPGGGKLHQ